MAPNGAKIHSGDKKFIFSHGVLEGDEEKKLENKQWVLVVYG